MIDNPPLLSIHRGFRRPDPALVEQFRGAQTSHLADAMDGRGALDYRIKPLDPANASFAGPALTAFAYPADIVAMFGALSEAEAGDVIVLANDGYTRTAVIGDIAAGMMKNKGVAAFVTDGLARDRAGIIAAGLPVFCRGIHPNSPAMNGPGHRRCRGDAGGCACRARGCDRRRCGWRRRRAGRAVTSGARSAGGGAGGRGAHYRAGQQGRNDGGRGDAGDRAGEDHRRVRRP